MGMAADYNVLFLCTGNSARSIMAEALVNKKANGRLAAFSAGTHPKGTLHPEALQQLTAVGISVEGLRSKSWDEFAAPGAPHMDFIITVCDRAVNEPCPAWPGRPASAHWSIPDPAAVQGTPEEVTRAFHEAFTLLDRRINLLLALPLSQLEEMAREQEIAQLGRAA